jgi:hypothetical protein
MIMMKKERWNIVTRERQDNSIRIRILKTNSLENGSL